MKKRYLGDWIHRSAEWVKNLPHRLAAIPHSPHDIAKAFAIGVFIGILPGTGVAVALGVAFIFRMSKAAAVLGALVINPWTVAFFYAASYRVGVWFTRLEEPILWRTVLTFQPQWQSELLRATPTLLIGSMVLGGLVAMTSYVIVRWIVTEYRKKRIEFSHHHHHHHS